MNLLKTTAVLTCLLGSSIATADIYQYKDCDGNGTTFLTELNAEPGVDLSGLYLGCANLEWHNLSDADLSYVVLFAAWLHGANLSGADLTGAILNAAQLSSADLGGANLTGADLTGTHLFYADLSYTNLSGANLINSVAWLYATWTGATYDDDTLFPGGMDPVEYGMVYVPQVTGACCFLKEFCYWECLELSEEDCMVEYAATWYGIGSRCEDIECPDPCLGACCLGGSQCVLTVQALCEAEEGTFHAYKMCDEIECECPGDLNGDGVVNILDLLKVINYWGACP